MPQKNLPILNLQFSLDVVFKKYINNGNFTLNNLLIRFTYLKTNYCAMWIPKLCKSTSPPSISVNKYIRLTPLRNLE